MTSEDHSLDSLNSLSGLLAKLKSENEQLRKLAGLTGDEPVPTEIIYKQAPIIREKVFEVPTGYEKYQYTNGLIHKILRFNNNHQFNGLCEYFTCCGPISDQRWYRSTQMYRDGILHGVCESNTASSQNIEEYDNGVLQYAEFYTSGQKTHSIELIDGKKLWKKYRDDVVVEQRFI